MAEPIPFKEANADFGPGRNDPDKVSSLPAFVGHDAGGTPVIISCWRFTTPELEEIARTGCLWVWVYGSQTPPVSVSASTPFRKPA